VSEFSPSSWLRLAVVGFGWLRLASIGCGWLRLVAFEKGSCIRERVLDSKGVLDSKRGLGEQALVFKKSRWHRRLRGAFWMTKGSGEQRDLGEQSSVTKLTENMFLRKFRNSPFQDSESEKFFKNLRFQTLKFLPNVFLQMVGGVYASY
jgi:hypothetical protein